MSEAATRSLTAGERRARAAADMGVALVLTMVVWPFPLARASLEPLVHVALILIAWDVMVVAYHVVCARFWRATAASHLMGFALVPRTDDGSTRPAQLMRWGAVAGALCPVVLVAPQVESVVVRSSGLELVALSKETP